VGNVFKAGHRVRVDIATSDFPCFEVNPIASHNTVYHDAAHPSRLILPEVVR
jgi:predicted acyl esterase